MKVSVIVPIYNVEMYVGKCIDSILSQTFTDWELLLVDDGSTDNSGYICDNYAKNDPRITVIHKENGGVVSTRDCGVNHAKGDFILFIDGDDFISSDALELFFKKQVENDADLVRGGYLYSDENGNEAGPTYIAPENITTKQEWIDYVMLSGICSICNNLIKTDLFKKSVNVPSHLKMGEDFIASLQLTKNINKVAIVNKVTYYYVQRNTSVIGRSKTDNYFWAEKHIPMLIETDKILDQYKRNNLNIDFNKIEIKLLSILCKGVLPFNQLIEENRQVLKYLYVKYYVKSSANRRKTFVKSPRRYLRYWLAGLKLLK